MKTLFLDDEQCQLLREMLDFVPLRARYLPFVVDLLQRIPEPEAVVPAAGSTPPAVHSSPTGGGFQLRAVNPKNQAVLESIFSRLPHGDSL